MKLSFWLFACSHFLHYPHQLQPMFTSIICIYVQVYSPLCMCSFFLLACQIVCLNENERNLLWTRLFLENVKSLKKEPPSQHCGFKFENLTNSFALICSTPIYQSVFVCFCLLFFFKWMNLLLLLCCCGTGSTSNQWGGGVHKKS